MLPVRFQQDKREPGQGTMKRPDRALIPREAGYMGWCSCSSAKTRQPVVLRVKVEPMGSSLTIAEAASLGGKSKSERKMAAARRNLAKAHAARSEKLARKKSRVAIT